MPEHTAPEPGFTVNDPKVHNLIQGQQIDLHMHQPAPAPAPVHSFADGPLLIGRIPALAASRQERPADKELAARLADPNGTTACQVLSGMGGVGKTQIAAAYARKLWDAGELDLLVWVNAASREAVSAALAEAGVAVCGADGNQAAAAFLTWLDRPNSPRWLVVLDDVADPDHLTGLWPPEAAQGRTIVTTRSRNAALQGAQRVRTNIGIFSRTEGAAFLKRRLGDDARLLDGAEALSQDLGHLPLALAQAAAFILDRPGLTCAGYRQALQDKTIGLARLTPAALPDDYPRSAAAALHLSLDAADQHELKGLAAGILDLASLLDPSGIPAELFTSESALDMLREGVHSEAEIGEWQVQDALARLHQLSIVDHDGKTVRIHALVQLAVRERLSPGTIRSSAEAAVFALLDIWPLDFNLERSSVFRANAARLRETGASEMNSELAYFLVARAGNSLLETGQNSTAISYVEQALTEFARIHGPDHELTLRIQRHLAWTYSYAGQFAKAIAHAEQVLPQLVRVLGPEDDFVFKLRKDLAEAQADHGDVASATAGLEKLLIHQSRVLGPDHLDTLNTRRSLADMLETSGDSERALAAYESLLADQVRALKPDHSETLATRTAIAQCRCSVGDLSGAIAMLEAVLADVIRVLGPHTPRELAIREILTHWYADAGRVEEATRAIEVLLSDKIREFGPDHPQTLMTRKNLALRLEQNDEAAKALSANESLLDHQLRILGADHPEVLATRTNLAISYGRAGDAKRAAAELEQLLHDQERVLGPGSPDLFRTRRQLIRWRSETRTRRSLFRRRSNDRARDIQFRDTTLLLTEMRRVLGPGHRETLVTRLVLASLQGEGGDAAGAAAAFDSLIPDLLRVFGADHPNVFNAQESLAVYQKQAEKYQ
jgi:tetratricopeptide (TPR) repeat protein